jgi:acyl-CoA thioester hydrolase
MREHVAEVRVRYAETDQMGAVYNAHFLTYFEVARTEFLRSLGAVYRELEERGVYLVVVEAHCRYLAPARYDDVLQITTRVARLRPTRIDFAHVVRRKGEGGEAVDVAEGRVVLACLDAEGRPRRLPPEIADAVEETDGS